MFVIIGVIANSSNVILCDQNGSCRVCDFMTLSNEMLPSISNVSPMFRSILGLENIPQYTKDGEPVGTPKFVKLKEIQTPFGGTLIRVIDHHFKIHDLDTATYEEWVNKYKSYSWESEKPKAEIPVQEVAAEKSAMDTQVTSSEPSKVEYAFEGFISKSPDIESPILKSDSVISVAEAPMVESSIKKPEPTIIDDSDDIWSEETLSAADFDAVEDNYSYDDHEDSQDVDESFEDTKEPSLDGIMKDVVSNLENLKFEPVAEEAIKSNKNNISYDTRPQSNKEVPIGTIIGTTKVLLANTKGKIRKTSVNSLNGVYNLASLPVYDDNLDCVENKSCVVINLKPITVIDTDFNISTMGDEAPFSVFMENYYSGAISNNETACKLLYKGNRNDLPMLTTSFNPIKATISDNITTEVIEEYVKSVIDSIYDNMTENYTYDDVTFGNYVAIYFHAYHVLSAQVVKQAMLLGMKGVAYKNVYVRFSYDSPCEDIYSCYCLIDYSNTGKFPILMKNPECSIYAPYITDIKRFVVAKGNSNITLILPSLNKIKGCAEELCWNGNLILPMVETMEGIVFSNKAKIYAVYAPKLRSIKDVIFSGRSLTDVCFSSLEFIHCLKAPCVDFLKENLHIRKDTGKRVYKNHIREDWDYCENLIDSCEHISGPFTDCTQLKYLSLPSLKSIPRRGLACMGELEVLNIPKLRGIHSMGLDNTSVKNLIINSEEILVYRDDNVPSSFHCDAVCTLLNGYDYNGVKVNRNGFVDKYKAFCMKLFKLVNKYGADYNSLMTAEEKEELYRE